MSTHTTPMPQHNHKTGPTPNTTNAGFTLIEVLIAAIILSLGTLGLLVLFAGAAQQQRDATETTTSYIASGSAASILERRFANIDGRIDPATSQNAIDRVSDGVWYLVPAETQGTDEEGTLSIDPQDTGEIFFVIDQNDPVVLYEARAQANQLDGAADFRKNGTSDAAFNPVDGTPTVRDFPHRRIEPESLPAILVVTDDAPNVTLANQQGQRTLVYSRVSRNAAPPGSTFRDWQQADPNGLELYTPGAAFPPPSDDHILLDLKADDPDTGLQPGDEPAEVLSFFINAVDQATAPNNRMIRRIVAPSYTYRAAAAISLEDRLQRNSQGRPTLGYSLLFRAEPDGVPELGVFTFAIRSRLSPDTPQFTEFRPDESIDDDPDSPGFGRPNDQAPLRLVDTTLAFDPDFEQYYLTVDNENDRFAIDIGQIVLVADGPDAVDTPFGTRDLAGSDVPVTVIGQRRVGNEVRGYLNRVPRSRCNPMLTNRGGTTELEIVVVQREVNDLNGNTFLLEPRAFESFPLQR